MKAFGPRVRQPIERRRQHVLASVLLHVLQPSAQSMRAVHRSLGQFTIHHVQNAPGVCRSTTSTTFASPRRPVSNGCPPDVG